jgi:hypothetical protein
MLKRFLKGVWSFHRLPEIGACRKATPQWIRLTACYLGFPITLPFEIQLATGPFRLRMSARSGRFSLAESMRCGAVTG